MSRYALGQAIARAYHLDTAHLTAAPIPVGSPVVADVRLDSGLARNLLKTRLRDAYEWLGVEPLAEL